MELGSLGLGPAQWPEPSSKSQLPCLCQAEITPSLLEGRRQCYVKCLIQSRSKSSCSTKCLVPSFLLQMGSSFRLTNWQPSRWSALWPQNQQEKEQRAVGEVTVGLGVLVDIAVCQGSPLSLTQAIAKEWAWSPGFKSGSHAKDAPRLLRKEPAQRPRAVGVEGPIYCLQ